MNSITVATNVMSYARVRTTDSTDSAFTARVAIRDAAGTITQSRGAGAAQATAPAIIDMYGGGVTSTNMLKLVPYGTDTNNLTFSMRVIGWSKLDEGDKNTTIWIPIILGEVSCTLSSSCTGVAGGIIPAATYFCDTIAVTYGTSGIDLSVTSPAADIPAHVVVDTKGCQFVEVQFDMTGAASGNALYSAY